MSNVYIARQPIFDQKMKLFGYELLYRKSENNFFEGTDDEQATAAVLDNLFFIGFQELTEGTRGFINFSEKMLLDEVPAMLPKDHVVIEILENVQFNDAVLNSCRKYKETGYMLALDDFDFTQDNRNNTSLFELVDIIKVEKARCMTTRQINYIKNFKKDIIFLVERIETREEYKKFIEMGYTLFQGFFFSKPIMFGAKDIATLDMNLILILNELYKSEPDYKCISSIIERDLGLSYKLLRIVNSAYYSIRYQVKSIQQAMTHLGTQELYRWVHVMLIKGVQNKDNAELVRTSIIRGKMLALLANKAHMQKAESNYFITGIFSSIDVILNQDMAAIINGLPLTSDVKEALLGNDNYLRKALNAVLGFERAQWNLIDQLAVDLGFEKGDIASAYLEAIRWQRSYAV